MLYCGAVFCLVSGITGFVSVGKFETEPGADKACPRKQAHTHQILSISSYWINYRSSWVVVLWSRGSLLPTQSRAIYKCHHLTLAPCSLFLLLVQLNSSQVNRPLPGARFAHEKSVCILVGPNYGETKKKTSTARQKQHKISIAVSHPLNFIPMIAIPPNLL